MPRGLVKWFDDDRGFGFITPADRSEDTFVNCSAIQSEDYPTLKEGVAVEYEMERSSKGPIAVNVRNAGAPSRPELCKRGGSPAVGVKSFTSKSLRELEWDINQWVVVEKVAPVSVSVTRSADVLGNLVVGALVAFRRIGL